MIELISLFFLSLFIVFLVGKNLFEESSNDDVMTSHNLPMKMHDEE